MVSPPAHRTRVRVPRSSKKANTRIPAFDVKLFLETAGLGKKVARFPGNETIFAQGDPAKSVMYIKEGVAVLRVVNEAGKEAFFSSLGPGDFLGEGCLAGQS